jgi:hypothetical protein
MLGRKIKTELEGKRDLLYKKLKDLDTSRNRLESDIEETVDKIAREERKTLQPKMYYDLLDEYVTVEEFIEYEAFFNQRIPDLSTDLTSIC